MKYSTLSATAVLFLLWTAYTGCQVADANAETETNYISTAPDPRLNPEPAAESKLPAKAVKRATAPINLNVDTVGKDIAGLNCKQHLRIYTPKTGKAQYPIIVFYHGQAFENCDLNQYDTVADMLAHKADAIVVAVNYEAKGQHRYPTTHSNAYAAYEWVLKNARSFKGDTNRVALTGEGSGGNIAIATAAKARDGEITAPRIVLAFYPKANIDKVDNASTLLSDAVIVSYSSVNQNTARTIVPPANNGVEVAVEELLNAIDM